MRYWKYWLGGFALLFVIYVVMLVVFVRRQSVAQTEHVLWSSRLGYSRIINMQHNQAGELLLTNEDGRLTMFTPDGRKLWETASGGYGYGYSSFDTVILPDDGILLMDSGNNSGQNPQGQPGGAFLHHFDRTGAELARITPSFNVDPVMGLMLLGDKIILKDGNGELHAVDMQGQEIWNSHCQAGLQRIPGPDDGLLVLDVNSVSQAAELSLLAGADGAELWRIVLPGDFGSSLQMAGERIWYIDGAGKLRELDNRGMETGKAPQFGNTAFPVLGMGVLQYGGYAGTEEQIVQDESGNLLVALDYQDLRLYNPDFTERCRISAPFGTTSMALDSQRQRVVLAAFEGVNVYDYDGKLVKSNRYLNSYGTCLLDRQQGQFYLVDGDTLYCIAY